MSPNKFISKVLWDAGQVYVGRQDGAPSTQIYKGEKKYRCLCFIIVQPYHNFWEWGIEPTL